MSITDSDYTLPQIFPTQVVGTAKGGANRPLFIRGIDIHTGVENDFVLKYRGAERMDERTSARELVASFLATSLGIHTPKPVKILVEDAFLNNLKEHSDYQNIQKSKGINFGTVKVEPNNTIVIGQLLSAEQRQQALKIFLFDVWIQNGDRRFEKPNMFLCDENIYVIDHELAFGFIDTLPFLRSSHAFLLNDVDINAARNHFFYATLHQNKQFDFDAAFQPFVLLPPIFWQRLRLTVPSEWQKSDEIDQIEAHFNQILSNYETFKKEIWTKLLA